MRLFLQPLFLVVVLAMLANSAVRAGTDDDIAFFESKIRPVLVASCYKCHSGQTKAPKGGLRVDSRAALLRGGDSGPALVPGKPDESLIIKAINYEGAVVEMPPKEKLPARVLADFRRWVAAGAVDPRVDTSVVARKTAEVGPRTNTDFWTFRPPVRPGVPSVRDKAWPRNAVDYFLLARLEEHGLRPVPDADRYTWLRRVSLDLVGLPPSPAQIAEFVIDRSPSADERAVDRLLASPAFGERWARHWLDLTGYADQIGTSNDLFAEHAWKYRDYVIAACNGDTPLDRFIHEQIAGDLLPSDRAEDHARNLVATGFLLLGDLPVVEADKDKLRVDVIDQQVDKIGKAFLGLTIGCARCHDHKFDPISQRDYYALAGIFQNTRSVGKAEWGVWSWPTVVKLPESQAQAAEREARLASHQQKVAALRAESEQARQRSEAIARILNDPHGAAFPKDKSGRDALEAEKRGLDGRIGAIAGQIEHAEFFAPTASLAFAVNDVAQPTDMRITIRGDAHALGELVPRGFITVLARNQSVTIPKGASGRKELADWIASAANPLTARVAVNRVWQALFGEGLVRSVDYFGTRSDPPTHPELLDFLAKQFVEDGWSRKTLIRRLVLSRAYRMGSTHDAHASSVDPENRLLWRMNRRRLDAESLRDSLLAVSGRLAPSMGGPGLPLEYQENSGGLGKGGVNPPSFRLARFRPEQEFVRTVYLPVIRSAPQPGPAEVRNVFDFTQPGEFAGQRFVTTVPTQALFLMNAHLLKQRARDLAELTLTTVAVENNRLDSLWLTALNRPITDAERVDALAFLADMRDVHRTLAPAARELRAWAELCHALLASNEFLVRL